MVGWSDPKCWLLVILGPVGHKENISNTGADQLCRSSWSCCGKLQPLKRPQFRQKMSANFWAWQVPNIDPNWSLLCPTAILMPCASMCQLCQQCFWKWGDAMGSPLEMVIFRGNTVMFSMGWLFFAEKALSLMIVIVTVMASSQNSDFFI